MAGIPVGFVAALGWFFNAMPPSNLSSRAALGDPRQARQRTALEHVLNRRSTILQHARPSEQRFDSALVGWSYNIPPFRCLVAFAATQGTSRRSRNWRSCCSRTWSFRSPPETVRFCCRKTRLSFGLCSSLSDRLCSWSLICAGVAAAVVVYGAVLHVGPDLLDSSSRRTCPLDSHCT